MFVKEKTTIADFLFDFQNYNFSSVWQNFFSVLKKNPNFAISKTVASMTVYNYKCFIVR